MTVETKYNIGDKLWIMERPMIQKPAECDFCESTGKITHNGDSYVCPVCEGYTDLVPGEWKLNIKPIEVQQIKISRDYITYAEYGGFYSEDSVFLNYFECLRECKRRNGNAV